MPQDTPCASPANRAGKPLSQAAGAVRAGFGSALARLAESAGALDAALPAVAELLHGSGACDVLFAIRGVPGHGALRLERITEKGADPSPLEQAELLLLAQKALGTKSGMSIASVHGGQRIVAVAPVIAPAGQRPAGAEAPAPGEGGASAECGRCVALAGTRGVPAAPQSDRPDLLTALELVVASLAGGPGGDHSRATAALVEMMTRALDQPGFEETCGKLAAIVREHLECRSVWIAVRRASGMCEVVGIAGANAKKGSEEFSAHVAALNEALIRDRLTVWPAVDPAERWGCLAHQRALEQSGAEALLSAPLRKSQGKAVGAWLLAGDRARLTGSRSLAWVGAAEEPAATILETSRLANQSAWQRLKPRLPANGRRSPRILIAVPVVLAAALAAPAPHRVSCECELQPVSRRFVTVPFDGRLEHGAVKPGDTVAAGELLARMDGREVGLELAAVDADLHRAAKRRDGELAEHDFAAAHLSRFEVQRLTARSELLRTRAGQLDIGSPIAGIVVSGDLQRMDGAALKVGQTLYEIAPLERMTVEIAIPEDDVSHVRPEMPLCVRLDAARTKPIEGKLARIHPRSETRYERNVFIGELEIDNADGALRPGMRGTARLSAGWRPLGWIWFHKAWERLQSWW